MDEPNERHLSYCGLVWKVFYIKCLLTLMTCFSGLASGDYGFPNEGGVVGDGNGTQLLIASLMPMTGAWPGGTAMLISSRIALDTINKSPDILPGYTLKLIYKESKFQVYKGVHALNQLLQSSPPKVMVLAAANSELSQAAALVSDLHNLVQVSYASVTPDLSDKGTYPRFFRTSQPDTSMNPARIALFQHFNWEKVATIHQSRVVFDAVATDIQIRLKAENITLLTSEVFQNDPRHQVINLKKHDARIIMAVANKPLALRILCEAYKNGLYGPKYVWFYPGWFDNGWWNEAIDECSLEQMQAAAEGYFTATSVTLNPSNSKTVSGLTPSEFMAAYNKGANNTNLFAFSLMPQAFEALWVMALTLNKTETDLIESGSTKRLSDFSYDDSEMAALILNNMKNISFEGIMGPFRFNENHDPKAYINIKRLQDGLMQSISLYVNNDEQGGHFNWSQETPLVWADGRPPVDANIIVVERVAVPPIAYTVASLLSGVGILISLMFLIINIKYSATRVIKMSSPNINNLILIGCILAYLTVFLQTSDSSFATAICMTKSLTLSAGFSLVFGALFSKTWRIHKIFSQKTATKKVIKDSHLILMVFSLLFINTLILLLWYTIDPLHLVFDYSTRPQVLQRYSDIIVQDESMACESQYQLQFLGVILGIQGFLILFGAFLAYETRKVTIPALNDSKHIGLCVYNVFILSLVTVILAFAISNNVTLYYLTTSIFIILGTTSTLCILFIPKVKKLHEIKIHGESADDYTQSTIQQKTQGTHIPQSSQNDEERQQVTVIRQELVMKDKCIADLKDELAAAKATASSEA